jgi:hypothetical protein
VDVETASLSPESIAKIVQTGKGSDIGAVFGGAFGEIKKPPAVFRRGLWFAGVSSCPLVSRPVTAW